MDENLNIEKRVERVVRFFLPIRSVNLDGTYGDVIMRLPYTIRSVNGDGTYSGPDKSQKVKK